MNLLSENAKLRIIHRVTHFMLYSMLELLPRTQIKPVSASGAVCPANICGKDQRTLFLSSSSSEREKVKDRLSPFSSSDLSDLQGVPSVPAAKIPFSQAAQGRKLKTQANPVPQADGTPCIFRFFCFVKNILDEFSECLSCFSGISAPPPPHAQLQLLHGPEVLRQFVLVINDCRRLSTKSICFYFTQ